MWKAHDTLLVVAAVGAIAVINQYFGMSVADTIKTWSVMETLISVVGPGFVMVLSVVV
jgi:H+/gluconate symporter-like permease